MTTFDIRGARAADALAVAQIHVRTWQAAYRGLLPDAYLAGLQPEDRARRYTFEKLEPGSPRTIVALERDTLVGFATVRVTDPDRRLGELAALYVDPVHWNRGAGAALIAAARAELVGLGCHSAHLWLLEGNRRGERFYRIDGWSLDGSRRTDRVWDVDVTEAGMHRDLP